MTDDQDACDLLDAYQPETFAVIYERPDGWWCAGDGFESATEAYEAGRDQISRRTNWKVVVSYELPQVLCAEGLEALTEA